MTAGLVGHFSMLVFGSPLGPSNNEFGALRCSFFRQRDANLALRCLALPGRPSGLIEAWTRAFGAVGNFEGSVFSGRKWPQNARPGGIGWAGSGRLS